MFDFGFSELVVIGAVGLVVLGPKRLPIVARQIGQWIGKAQRLVQQVKGDIARESELAELKDIQKQATDIASDLDKTIKGQANDIEKNWSQIQSQFDDASKKVGKELKDVAEQADAAMKSDSAVSSPVNSDLPSAASSTSESLPDYAKPDMAAIVENSTPAYLEESLAGDEYQPYSDPSSGSKVFEKRYRPGPSIEDVVEQVERLKTEVGDRSPLLVGYNCRYAPRSRSNRVRIYR